jgi:hypothetical protein
MTYYRYFDLIRKRRQTYLRAELKKRTTTTSFRKSRVVGDMNS